MSSRPFLMAAACGARRRDRAAQATILRRAVYYTPLAGSAAETCPIPGAPVFPPAPTICRNGDARASLLDGGGAPLLAVVPAGGVGTALERRVRRPAAAGARCVCRFSSGAERPPAYAAPDVHGNARAPALGAGPRRPPSRAPASRSGALTPAASGDDDTSALTASPRPASLRSRRRIACTRRGGRSIGLGPAHQARSRRALPERSCAASPTHAGGVRFGRSGERGCRRGFGRPQPPPRPAVTAFWLFRAVAYAGCCLRPCELTTRRVESLAADLDTRHPPPHLYAWVGSWELVFPDGQLLAYATARESSCSPPLGREDALPLAAAPPCAAHPVGVPRRPVGDVPADRGRWVAARLAGPFVAQGPLGSVRGELHLVAGR